MATNGNMILHVLPTLVSALGLAGILWVGAQIVTLNADVAVIKYQNEAVLERLDKVEARILNLEVKGSDVWPDTTRRGAP
jgi:hypothetical protein